LGNSINVFYIEQVRSRDSESNSRNTCEQKATLSTLHTCTLMQKAAFLKPL
jgi:hypothetical protein